MKTKRARIGLIGFGYLGKHIYREISSRPELGLEVAFVAARETEKLAGVPQALKLAELGSAVGRQVDLVVELAHPEVTRLYGERILGETDYLPLSITAFADEALQQRLLDTAQRNHTQLFLPHGAVVGLENIYEGRHLWTEVSVVMKKNPRNLDFQSAPQFDPAHIRSATVLYDGPTRGICPLFPRNVNSHATVALAGLGFDRTRSVLVADPALEVSVIEVTARGQGASLRIERANPLQGVSGTFTLQSTLAAITRAKGATGVMQLC